MYKTMVYNCLQSAVDTKYFSFSILSITNDFLFACKAYYIILYF